MLAKETAVSLSRYVRQSGYISRVNDSDISISVSVRWGCPYQLYRDECLLRARLPSSRLADSSGLLPSGPLSSPSPLLVLRFLCARSRWTGQISGPAKSVWGDAMTKTRENTWFVPSKMRGGGGRKVRRTDSECTRCRRRKDTDHLTETLIGNLHDVTIRIYV